MHKKVVFMAIKFSIVVQFPYIRQKINGMDLIQVKNTFITFLARS